MAPGALSGTRTTPRRTSSIRTKIASTAKNCLLSRSINTRPIRVKEGVGNYWVSEDGRLIYDASGGASVATIGKYDKQVEKAMVNTFRKGLSYVPSLAFDTQVTADLADLLIKSTDNKMEKFVSYSSGSEASEAAIKLSIQYHTEDKPNAEKTRTQFIAREQSYHGSTLGALDLSGHEARKKMYEDILPGIVHTVPACHPYQNRNGRTDDEYVEWHKENLVQKIEELGKENVAGFILEPVVGAALGCATSVPGYLHAMREVCDKYDVLLIFDEVMCGLGRTGYFHAWQEENVVPDIQLIGKALASGFQPISGMLVGPKVTSALRNGPSNGVFNHGHTFQNHPMGAAAALEVQRIFNERGYLKDIREKGPLLQKKLRARLESHRYVGDIRGPPRGLFIGIDFVQNKETKMAFPSSENMAAKIYERGKQDPHNIHVYPGSWTNHGLNGDHIMISPAYNITLDEVDMIVERVGTLVERFFDEYDRTHV